MATLSDYGIRVVESMTTPSKPGKAPRPVWNIEGQTNGYEEILYSLGAKKWKGVFSFWDDPSEALLEAIEEQSKTNFAERMENQKARAAERAERFQDRAEAAVERSDAAHEKFRALLSPIPMGQPILVGHHSEQRHRKALERADNALGQAVEEADKAKYYKRRAASSAFKAEDRDPAFMHRRLKESEALVRKIQRNLAKIEEGCRYSTPEQLATWKSRCENLLQEHTERVAYWKEQIAASGAGEVKDGLSEADNAKKSSIKKTDFIYRDRGWWQVIRVNRKTVTAQCLTPGCEHYKPQIPFAEIEKVMTAEDYEQRMSAKGKENT
jgi:hypothetical protein